MTYSMCIITKNKVSSWSHVFSETEESDRLLSSWRVMQVVDMQSSQYSEDLLSKERIVEKDYWQDQVIHINTHHTHAHTHTHACRLITVRYWGAERQKFWKLIDMQFKSKTLWNKPYFEHIIHVVILRYLTTIAGQVGRPVSQTWSSTIEMMPQQDVTQSPTFQFIKIWITTELLDTRGALQSQDCHGVSVIVDTSNFSCVTQCIMWEPV